MSVLNRRTLFAFLFAGILITACGKPAEEQSDIPITTSSEDARQAFLDGRDQWEIGKRDEARALFDRAIAADPSFAYAYVMRARTATSPSDWKKHAELAIENREHASPAEQKLVDQLAAFMNDDEEKAFALMEALAGDLPESARAQVMYAFALEDMDKTADARTVLEKATTLDERWGMPHRALANSYIFREPRDLEKAREHALRYVELRPDAADSHITLGDVYRAQGDLEAARTAYGKAAEVDASSDVAFSKKGHAESFLGNFEEARADFAAAANVSKTWKVGAKNFGVYTWIYAGDMGAALDANQAVLDEIDGMSDDPAQRRQMRIGCLEDRALIASASGDFATAEEAFAQLAELQRMVMEEMANESYTKQQEAWLALLEGRIALRKGDMAAATAAADRADQRTDGLNSPQAKDGVFFLRGLIALEQEDAAAALGHFANGDDESIEVTFYSAMAHEALGEKDKAMALYQEVADWNFNGLNYALIRGTALSKLAS